VTPAERRSPPKSIVQPTLVPVVSLEIVRNWQLTGRPPASHVHCTVTFDLYHPLQFSGAGVQWGVIVSAAAALSGAKTSPAAAAASRAPSTRAVTT
jgi:hypothetical protein